MTTSNHFAIWRALICKMRFTNTSGDDGIGGDDRRHLLSVTYIQKITLSALHLKYINSFNLHKPYNYDYCYYASNDYCIIILISQRFPGYCEALGSSHV